MMDQWYYAQDGHRFGPLSWPELRRCALNGRVRPIDLVWQTGMADWQPAYLLETLFAPAPPPPAPKPAPKHAWRNPLAQAPAAHDGPQRIVCGVLALIFGALGVHKFLLGRTGAGLAVLIPTLASFGALALFTAPLGLVEGLVYLGRSDAEFERLYIRGVRAWF